MSANEFGAGRASLALGERGKSVASRKISTKRSLLGNTLVRGSPTTLEGRLCAEGRAIIIGLVIKRALYCEIVTSGGRSRGVTFVCEVERDSYRLVSKTSSI